MSVQIKRRGDTTAAHADFIGAKREITIDTDKQVVVVHDGETSGGFPLAREDLSNVSAASIKNRGGVLAADLVGMVIAAPLDNFAGFILCNGAAISRISYAALYAKIGTTFGVGDGSTTFNIPDYRGYFLRGKGGNSADDFTTAQSDAAPNITASMRICRQKYSPYWMIFDPSGALYDAGDDGSGSGIADTSNQLFRRFYFNASRSSAVYGRASEVRPTNKAINYFIKY